MQREVKFRGKTGTTEGKKWIYGYYYEVKSFFCDKKGHFISVIRDDHLLDFNIDKDTLGQYTGLKDKNGKEIYEGDIVKYNEFWEGDCHYNSGCGQILWDDEETGFYLTAKDTSYIDLFNVTRNLDGEVIGNIYDNSTLLEKGEER